MIYLVSLDYLHLKGYDHVRYLITSWWTNTGFTWSKLWRHQMLQFSYHAHTSYCRSIAGTRRPPLLPSPVRRLYPVPRPRYSHVRRLFQPCQTFEWHPRTSIASCYWHNGTGKTGQALCREGSFHLTPTYREGRAVYRTAPRRHTLAAACLSQDTEIASSFEYIIFVSRTPHMMVQ